METVRSRWERFQPCGGGGGGVVLEALFNSLDKQPSVSLQNRRPSTPCAFFQERRWLSEPASEYSITYRNNKPGVCCRGQSTVHYYILPGCLHDWGTCRLNVSVNTCQAQLQEVAFFFFFFKAFLLHCLIYWNTLQIWIATVSILPGLSYIKKYF